MKRLHQALRVVMPSTWLLWAIPALVAAAELPFVWLEWRLGGKIFAATRPSEAFLRFVFLGYGYYRATAFHPAYNVDYARWLATTPWTRARPLPLGPVRLVWQDVLLLTLGMAGASLIPGVRATPLLATFFATYSGLLGLSFFWTGVRWYGYAVLFGLGLMTRLWASSGLCTWVGLLVYLVADAGLHHALGAFPWESRAQTAVTQVMESSRGDADSARAAAGPAYGWPFNPLAPTEQPHTVRLPRSDAILVSLLAGWWFYALGSLNRDPRSQVAFFSFVTGAGVGVLALFRVAVYCAGHAAPISLWGRIWTRHTIVPGYDRVFLGPALAAAVGLIGTGLIRFHHGPPAALPAIFTTALLVLLLASPSLSDWKLTGHHRLTPAGGRGQARGFVKAG